jgi:hypothetical protein
MPNKILVILYLGLVALFYYLGYHLNYIYSSVGHKILVLTIVNLINFAGCSYIVYCAFKNSKSAKRG